MIARGYGLQHLRLVGLFQRGYTCWRHCTGTYVHVFARPFAVLSWKLPYILPKKNMATAQEVQQVHRLREIPTYDSLIRASEPKS